MSDHKGAALIYSKLPNAQTLIADKGYDSDAFREALTLRGITPCIPPRAKRRTPASYCKTLYKQRLPVENMFAKLKDWRRLACAMTAVHTHSSARSASPRQSSSGSANES